VLIRTPVGGGSDKVRSVAGRSRKAPSFEGLVDDLKVLRSEGLIRLRTLNLPALKQAASAITDEVDPASIEHVLRQAVERLGGGELGDAASYLFGLVQGTRGQSPTELRRKAAFEGYGMKAENFRKTREPMVIAQVAEQVLALVGDARLRTTHHRMERREPAESRLAVEWVQRFEAYYRIWTPVYALGADLTAFRLTLLEENRSWDLPDTPGRRVEPLSLETEPYSQEYQAEGYVRFAMFHYAAVLWELKQFMIRHGGFWLLSSPDVETEVADALYRVGWHTPNNERDDSWMRVAMKNAAQELHLFQHTLDTTTIGSATHAEWQEWAATCRCTWVAEEASPSDRHFPDPSTHSGISSECQVHAVVAACNDYCALIDADWLAIADWYQIDAEPRRGVSADSMYADLRRQR